MSKIQKESIREYGPKDHSDLELQDNNPATHPPTVTSGDNPEKMQLADLQEFEKRYQAIFEAAPIGIAVANPQGYFIEVNDALVDMLGYGRREIGDLTFVDITHPDDRGETQRLSQAVRDGKINFYRTEKRYLKKDGEVVWVVVRATALRNDDGSINYWLGLMVDITEHKHAKEALAESEKKYRMLFESSAEGILVARIEDQKFNYANRTICRMLGYSSEELAQMEISPDNPLYDYLSAMEDYVKRGSDLTRQILGFARGGKYEAKPTNLNHLLEQSSQMFGRTRKDIVIHKKFQESPWPVEVDRGQIEQVLLNLFVNAAQVMPSGGDIFLENENVTLKEEDWDKPYALKQGAYVKIAVTDTGVGMDKDTLERIFEPFYTTKEVSRGTGLGLASAYGIIKNHNGMIDVASNKGRGSTFTIYLPRTRKAFPEERVPVEKAIKGRETILLVDDEEMVADVGQKMLQKLGYRVVVAKSGRKAVEIFKRLHQRIDLIILDMIMPDMGGSETFDQLKTIAPDVKVLLSSGYSIDGQASQIMKRGCNGFIQKPFNLKHFSRKIREILDA